MGLLKEIRHFFSRMLICGFRQSEEERMAEQEDIIRQHQEFVRLTQLELRQEAYELLTKLHRDMELIRDGFIKWVTEVTQGWGMEIDFEA